MIDNGIVYHLNYLTIQCAHMTIGQLSVHSKFSAPSSSHQHSWAVPQTSQTIHYIDLVPNQNDPQFSHPPQLQLMMMSKFEVQDTCVQWKYPASYCVCQRDYI